MNYPFVIFALPRSRTAWLSRFLTYGDWVCGHEELRHFRSMEDVQSWFRQPAIGSAETAAAPFWRTLLDVAPTVRVAVVRRPVESVFDSMMKLPVKFDRRALMATLRRLDHKLDQIEARVPGVLSVRFDDLATERGCAALFEHCLQCSHDPVWWRAWATVNVQADMVAMMRHFHASRPQLDRLAAQLKCLTVASLSRRSGMPDAEGLVIDTERLESFLAGGQNLFREHAVAVGQHPDAFRHKNLPLARALESVGSLQIVTARCNGRMFGYLVTVVGPSFEHENCEVAVHTAFYAGPEFRGLGMRLQKHALDLLSARGVGEIVFRAGVHGDGPRMSALYRRLGAREHGQLFLLETA